jgi:integrase
MRALAPSIDEMLNQGFAEVAHVPFLLDSDGRYLDEVNRYIRERALLEWLPEDAFPTGKLRSGLGRSSYPTVTSLRTLANRLSNFLAWCSARGLDWRRVEYTKHIVNRYQTEMLSGEWSLRSRELHGSTINRRTDEAILLLAWADQAGFRPSDAPPFNVPRASRRRHRKSTGSSSRSSVATIESRAGRVNTVPQLFSLPSPSEVATWISRVGLLRGAVKRLCCELIIATGVRVEECVQWQVDTLPLERGDWQIRGQIVKVLIRAGTKGHRNSPADLNGPPRWVSLPLELAEKLHRYREEVRVSQLARWIRSGTTDEERARRRRAAPPSRLFLGEVSNRPFTARMLRRAWSETPGCPNGWSPHKGRHYFACQKLIEVTTERANAAAQRLDMLNSDWLTGALNNDIQMIIRPLLGHVSEETTRHYIQWVRDWFASQSGVGSLRWQDYLEVGSDA